MGIIRRLVCSKKQCRSLFWRMRAAMKKAVKNHTFLVAFYGGPKKHFNFQYDPLSYALNFDDTTHHHHHHHHHDHHHYHVMEHHKFTKLPLPKHPQELPPSSSPTTTTPTWVNVIWVWVFLVSLLVLVSND